MILVGYSTFALIVVRSAANPPMDENNPGSLFALLSYLNREQYETDRSAPVGIQIPPMIRRIRMTTAMPRGSRATVCTSNAVRSAK